MPPALRVLGYRIAELLNVCAVYLGIAVLVTLVMVFTLAPLRTQVQQIHYALLNTLRPASVDNVLYAMLVSGDDDNRAVLESLLGIAALPSVDASRPEGADARTNAAAEAMADTINEDISKGRTPDTDTYSDFGLKIQAHPEYADFTYGMHTYNGIR